MHRIPAARGPKPPRHQPVSANATSAVTLRWLASAIALVFLIAAVCVWATLCFTFWQGSWQLLYHPSSVIARTPAAGGMAFDRVAFASSETGVTQLEGWWCAAARPSGYTAIYLHGARGNLGDAVDAIRPLHDAGFDVFAFDYRGYGQSQFRHPSEARWKQDAESALRYLTETRHVGARSVVFAGEQLGADLALEIAADHPEVAGVLVEFPVADPTIAIFDDPRARLVPARWLVRDRWDLREAAAKLRVPSLWLCPAPAPSADPDPKGAAAAYAAISAPKIKVELNARSGEAAGIEGAIAQWAATLGERH